jgi:hypothetical protein
MNWFSKQNSPDESNDSNTLFDSVQNLLKESRSKTRKEIRERIKKYASNGATYLLYSRGFIDDDFAAELSNEGFYVESKDSNTSFMGRLIKWDRKYVDNH